MDMFNNTHHTKKAGTLAAAALTVLGLGTTIGLSTAAADSGSDGASKGRVTAGTLSERVGPSTHVSTVEGDLSRGDVIEISCKLPGSSVGGNKTWYQVADSHYWVSARYVSLTGEGPDHCDKGSQQGTTTTAVNVRQAPTTQDQLLGSIRGGVSTVNVYCKVSGGNVGNNTFWYATGWGDGSETGYVHSQFVKVSGEVKFCDA